MMPAIRTQTFQFDPDDHGVETAADGGDYRPVRQGPSNPNAQGAQAMADKHDTQRRVTVKIAAFCQHEFADSAVIHLDPRLDGVAV